MEHVDVKNLVNQTLDALKRAGAGKKKLKNYKYCGFGPLLRYFGNNEVFSYSTDVVDDFISHIRSEYEHGKISRWKWNIVRRSAELLEQFHKTDSVEMAPLPKWEVLNNPLHQVPTPQQLADTGSLFSLTYRTKQELLKFGHKPKTISNYIYDGFDAILRHCEGNGETHYSKEAVDAFVAEARTKFENHAMCRSVYQNIRKVAAMLDECHETGSLEWTRIANWNLRRPTACYSDMLEIFCQETMRTGALADSTIATVRSAVRGFLFELEDSGVIDFRAVTLRVVSGCVTHMAVRYAGGLSAMLFSVRAFLRFLHEYGITSDDLSIAIPELIAPRRIVREGFHPDEINELLDCADRNTVVGKRDYAMMMLATQTGLRAVDIVNLERRDIDWRSNEIRITQHKTGHPLSIPLAAESGNAVADYLLNGRPKCNLPFIFLCGNHPYRPLNNRSASHRITLYMNLAGVDRQSIPRRGFHSFRRSFGGGLLTSEISLDMLSELLGHKHMDSAKPYLAANEAGLKTCALGLVEKVGGLQ